MYFKEAAEMSKMIHCGVLDMIQPGKTTIRDMRWWIYNKLAELDIDTWYFHGLRVHRQGVEGRLDADSTVIQPGDIINNDIGVVYMGFHTDYKGTGYVLKPGETEPPQGIQEAFKNSLRVQDAVFEIAKVGKPGHQVRADSMALCDKWGIDGSVYSHSVGVGGHGIGAWMNPNWPDRYGARAAFPLRLGAVYCRGVSRNDRYSRVGRTRAPHQYRGGRRLDRKRFQLRGAEAGEDPSDRQVKDKSACSWKETGDTI